MYSQPSEAPLRSLDPNLGTAALRLSAAQFIDFFNWIVPQRFRTSFPEESWPQRKLYCMCFIFCGRGETGELGKHANPTHKAPTRSGNPTQDLLAVRLLRHRAVHVFTAQTNVETSNLFLK